MRREASPVSFSDVSVLCPLAVVGFDNHPLDGVKPPTLPPVCWFGAFGPVLWGGLQLHAQLYGFN
jgi:hypothetical protein